MVSLWMISLVRRLLQLFVKLQNGFLVCSHTRFRQGVVLHHGDVQRYVQGRKTLTVTMPVYLNALSGKRVHVVTVNEYLTRQDATEMENFTHGLVFQ